MLSEQSRKSHLNNMFGKCTKFFLLLKKRILTIADNLELLSKQNQKEESNSFESIFPINSLDKIQKIDFVPNFETLIRNNYVPFEFKIININDEGQNVKTEESLVDPSQKYSFNQKNVLSKNLQENEIDSQLLNESIRKLLENGLIDNKEKIIEIFQNGRGLKIFCTLMENIKSPINLTNSNSFNSLGEITKGYLNGIVNAREQNPNLLYQVLLFSKNIFFIEKYKKPFYELINDHQIWKDYSKWVFCIDYIIRLSVYKRYVRNENLMKMQKEKEKSISDTNFSTFLKNPLKSMYHMISKNNEVTLNLSLGVKNTVVEILLNFAYFLGVFKVKTEIAQKILFLIAYKNYIELPKISDIFLEFQI